MMILAPGASYLAKYDVWCHKKDQIMMIIAPGASYGQAYSGSYDAGTASNYAVSKRSARSLPQVSYRHCQSHRHHHHCPTMSSTRGAHLVCLSIIIIIVDVLQKFLKLG